MILTIINIVVLIAIVVLVILLYLTVNSFSELIVRFVEQNQEFYKNQKHLMEKANQHAIELKKLSPLSTRYKQVLSKLERLSTKEK